MRTFFGMGSMRQLDSMGWSLLRKHSSNWLFCGNHGLSHEFELRFNKSFVVEENVNTYLDSKPSFQRKHIRVPQFLRKLSFEESGVILFLRIFVNVLYWEENAKKLHIWHVRQNKHFFSFEIEIRFARD